MDQALGSQGLLGITLKAKRVPKNNPRKVRPRRERELGDAANVDFMR